MLYDLGRFPDAKEHLEIWLGFLRKREDLELLHYVLLSVPRVSDPRLREALLEVQEAFPFALRTKRHWSVLSAGMRNAKSTKGPARF